MKMKTKDEEHNEFSFQGSASHHQFLQVSYHESSSSQKFRNCSVFFLPFSNMEDNFIRPWKCLAPSLEQPSLIPKPTMYFLQALANGAVYLSLSQLPTLCRKGDRLAIAIPEDPYKEGFP